MKIEIPAHTTKTIDVRFVRVYFPAEELDPDHFDKSLGGTEEQAEMFRSHFKSGDECIITVDLDTMTVPGWSGQHASGYFKPCDSFKWKALDADGNTLAESDYDYVPDLFDHAEGGGDYIDVELLPSGAWRHLRITPNRLADALASKTND